MELFIAFVPAHEIILHVHVFIKHFHMQLLSRQLGKNNLRVERRGKFQRTLSNQLYIKHLQICANFSHLLIAQQSL